MATRHSSTCSPAYRGITAQKRTPSGGEILHDDTGEPTGVLVDNAMSLVNLPEESPEQIHRRLLPRS